ncbi:MAG: hypothetical protein ACE5H4_04485 [Candidatus Thorarchaeota archaeon]
MSEKNLADIKKLIDSMQSGLVELFDQLRELRRVLDLASETLESDLSLSSSSLFSGVSTSSPGDSIKTDLNTHSDMKTNLDSVREESLTQPGITSVVSEDVSRVLDPITHELQTGDAPANVIAEYVQAAKEYLIKEDPANNKVARDMEVVLKFLRARGTRGIRPEERDNILKRIGRWKVHLSAFGEYAEG